MRKAVAVKQQHLMGRSSSRKTKQKEGLESEFSYFNKIQNSLKQKCYNKMIQLLKTRNPFKQIILLE